MRLSLIVEDKTIVIDGVPAVVRESRLRAPEGLHAIQVHPSGFTEVEWVDKYGRSVGTSTSLEKLPGGRDYLKHLVAIHKEAVELEEAKAKAEEAKVLQEAPDEPEVSDEPEEG